MIDRHTTNKKTDTVTTKKERGKEEFSFRK